VQDRANVMLKTSSTTQWWTYAHNI